jgi:hypothetical protein
MPPTLQSLARRHQLVKLLGGAVIAISMLAATQSPLFAQNDWQYPDPFFGGIQFERQAGQRGDWSWGLPRPATDRQLPADEPEAAAAEEMFRQRRPRRWRAYRRWQRSLRSAGAAR